MNNTNPQAVAFVDGKIRPISDLLAKVYQACEEIPSEYDARNLGAAIMPVDDNPIGDPTTDGRPTVTGNTCLGIIYVLNDLKTYFDANNKAKLNAVLNVSPNP